MSFSLNQFSETQFTDSQLAETQFTESQLPEIHYSEDLFPELHISQNKPFLVDYEDETNDSDLRLEKTKVNDSDDVELQAVSSKKKKKSTTSRVARKLNSVETVKPFKKPTSLKRKPELKLTFDVHKARKLAEALRGFKKEKLEKLTDNNTLSSLPSPCVIKIYGGKLIEISDSTSAQVKCSYQYNGSNKESEVVLPDRLFSNATKQEGSIKECLAVYLGKKEISDGISCYDIHLIQVQDQSLQVLKEELESLSPKALKHRFSILSLKDFPDYTTFICKSLREIEVKKPEFRIAYVMRYEVEIQGENLEGECFIPQYCAISIVKKKSESVLVLYRGKRLSKNNRDYFDIRVLDTNKTERFINEEV